MALPAKNDLRTYDDIGRSRLDWPEPLVLDIIMAAYDPTAGSEATIEAARLHARFLRALIDGETERSGPLRVDLIACCAARRITPEAIGAADHAVFSELSAIVQSRFRNSPRLRLHFVERLHDALGRLTSRKTPTKAEEKSRRFRVSYPARHPRQTLVLAG